MNKVTYNKNKYCSFSLYQSIPKLYKKKILKKYMAKSKTNTWLIVVIIIALINLVLAGVIINNIFFAEEQTIKTSDNTKVSANTNSNTAELIIGNPNAKVTLTEYSDFECPFCKRFYSDAYQQIKTEYVDTGKVKIVFKHFPLTNIHPNALPAAIAVECAVEQGKGPEMHDKVFESSSLTTAALKSIAVELKLDSTKFDACLDTEKYKEKVLADQKEGIAKGVTGTPTVFVENQKLVGAQPFSVFKTAIDTELAKK